MYFDELEHSIPESQRQIFFPVSITKLLVLSVCTFGIYECYWFYKNWKFVKENKGLKIKPVWRAIFSPLFCYGLFEAVKKHAKRTKVNVKYSSRWLTVGFILTIVTTGIPDPFWCISMLSVLILLPARSVIDTLNKKTNSTIRNDQFSGWNFAAIVSGVIVWGLVIWEM
jgi:hypothetical protein